MPGSAPSRWIIIGRYVCDPKVFDVLRQTPPGRGGEIQLTDALKVLASDPASGGVYGVLFRGRRYDTGNKLDYLRTVVTFASERRIWPRSSCPGSAPTWSRDRDYRGGHHHHHVSPKDLISVEAHLADILASIRPLPPTLLGITEAEGCVLAEDITASRPLPPFDNSAMDGYAVIAADVAGASRDAPSPCGSAARWRPVTPGPTRSPPAAACASRPAPSCPARPTRWCPSRTPTAASPR